MILPPLLDHLLRLSVQLAVRGLPPKGRGLRVARAVERVFPPAPGRMIRTRISPELKLTCDLSDRVQSSFFYTGKWEPELVRTFLSAVREGDTVLDIGANCGYYALRASVHAGRSGRVHAFEPSQPLTRQLRNELLALPSNAADLTVHSVAVSDTNGEVVLVDSPHAPGDHGERYISTESGRVGSTVRCVALDSYLPELKFHVAKIDVEGAELRVLRGMEGAIRRCRPRLLLAEALDANLMRFGDSIDGLVEMMHTLGYSGTLLSPPYCAPMLAFGPRRDKRL